MMRLISCGLIVLTLVGVSGCASRGRDVFVREGCVDCHRFRELGSGGAPDLSAVASQRDAAWIRIQIGNPATHNPATRMPPFPRITGFDLLSLVAFLRS